MAVAVVVVGVILRLGEPGAGIGVDDAYRHQPLALRRVADALGEVPRTLSAGLRQHDTDGGLVVMADFVGRAGVFQDDLRDLQQCLFPAFRDRAVGRHDLHEDEQVLVFSESVLPGLKIA